MSAKLHSTSVHMGERRPTTVAETEGVFNMKRLSLFVTAIALVALFVVPAAFAVTVPAVPVSAYGSTLLTELADAITLILPYAAAITAFAIGVGMLRRWLGHRKATSV